MEDDKKEPTLEDLLSQVTAENRHDEVDWGAPVGNEAWGTEGVVLSGVESSSVEALEKVRQHLQLILQVR